MNILFKVDKSLCMCGLSAFSGRLNLTPEQKLKVWNNMKTLGLYNESRGQHSCGMLVNGVVYKGFDGTKEEGDTSLFKDLIAKHRKLKWEGGPIMIHTRQATIGAKSAANCHPFEIKSVHEPKKDLIFMHNGSITNMWALCQKTEVPFADWTVDSHGLGMMVDKVGLEILKEYEGKAALVWTVAGESNSIFVYHGMYCEHHDDAPEKSWEERPMYFLETPEGIYISSMLNSLEAIAEDDQKPCNYIYNQVRQIKNGKWTKFVYEVDRLYGPNTKKKVESTWQQNNWNRYNNQGSFDHEKSKNFYNTHEWDNKTKTYVLKAEFEGKENNTPKYNKVWQEALPTQALTRTAGEERVYYWRGRFHLPGCILLNGCYHLDSKGYVVAKDSPRGQKHYFYAGIMLKGEISFNTLVAEDSKICAITKDKDINFALYMSQYSAYPVTNYIGESQKMNDHNRFGYYKDSKRCMGNCGYSTKFGSRNYTIDKDGFLANITTSDRKDKKIWQEGICQNGNLFTEVQTKCNYDVVFPDMDTALKSFIEPEMKAMMAYVADCLKNTQRLDTDKDEVEVELLENIADAIKKKVSIRVQLEDVNSGLEYFERVLSPRKDMISLTVGSRYTKGKSLSSASSEYKPEHMWDNKDQCWILTSLVRTRLSLENASKKLDFLENNAQSEIVEEVIPDDGSFLFDDTIGVDHYIHGKPYTAEGELIETDDDGYEFIMRSGTKIYIETKSELIKGATKDGLQTVHPEPLSIEEGLDFARMEEEEIINTVKDMINNLESISSQADDLAEITDSLLAGDMAQKFQSMIDSIKHGIAEIAEKHGITELSSLVNRTLNSNVVL